MIAMSEDAQMPCVQPQLAANQVSEAKDPNGAIAEIDVEPTDMLAELKVRLLLLRQRQHCDSSRLAIRTGVRDAGDICVHGGWPALVRKAPAKSVLMAFFAQCLTWFVWVD